MASKSFPVREDMQPTVQAGNQRPEPVKPKITITTFGTLQVTRDELAVTESDWHTRQARQLPQDPHHRAPAPGLYRPAHRNPVAE